MQMSVVEIRAWSEWFAWRQEQEKAAQESARMRSKMR